MPNYSFNLCRFNSNSINPNKIEKMNTQTELHGKFLIGYLPTNNGIRISNIEKIDKYTDIHESSEGRFKPKFQIEDTIEDVIDFVYQQKLYITKEHATEMVEEFLK